MLIMGVFGMLSKSNTYSLKGIIIVETATMIDEGRKKDKWQHVVERS
uniref:Uncharacterized protein n=1 Tax=Triticum urartu TaxID=4572 RepID=A0A8R7TZQ1_TRIUA